MNSKKLFLQQRLQSAEYHLFQLQAILQLNLNQSTVAPVFFSATLEQLYLIQAEFQSIVKTLAEDNDVLIAGLDDEVLTPLFLLQQSLQLYASGKFASFSEEAQFLMMVAFQQLNQLLRFVRELSLQL